MQVVIRLDYESYTANLSGTELDAFTKVLAKLEPSESHYGSALEPVKLRRSDRRARVDVTVASGTVPADPEPAPESES